MRWQQTTIDGRKSPAFWPNITVSKIENWLSSDVALCVPQKLTIIESALQGLKAKVEANDVHAERDIRDRPDRVRTPGETGMERSRNGFRPAVYTLHVLQQAIPRFRDRPGGRPT